MIFEKIKLLFLIIFYYILSLPFRVFCPVTNFSRDDLFIPIKINTFKRVLNLINKSLNKIINQIEAQKVFEQRSYYRLTEVKYILLYNDLSTVFISNVISI